MVKHEFPEDVSQLKGSLHPGQLGSNPACFLEVSPNSCRKFSASCLSENALWKLICLFKEYLISEM